MPSSLLAIRDVYPRGNRRSKREGKPPVVDADGVYRLDVVQSLEVHYRTTSVRYGSTPRLRPEGKDALYSPLSDL